MWSIDSKWLTVYFSLFTILSTINAARVIWYHAAQVAYENWSLVTDAIMHGIGINVIGSAGAALTITELGRFTMVLGGLLQDAIDRRREKQSAADRAAGRAEVVADVSAQLRELNDRNLREWNARRRQAERNGEPFDEPPPEPIELDLPDIGVNGSGTDDAPRRPGRNGA